MLVDLPNGHRMNGETEEKRCSHCKEWLPLEQFSGRKASKDGKSYNCRTCERKIAKKSYKKTRTKEKQRKYYEEHREEVLERSRENYQANKEHRLAKGKEYREKNPHVFKRADKKRRELLANAEREPYTREEIIQRDSERIGGELVCICQICNEPIWDLKELHIDHIIPIIEGGADAPHNVRAAHKKCNISRPKDGRDLKTTEETS